MSNSKWNNKDVPDQTNRIIIVTGATSGLGKQATQVLLQKNATVIMAVRNIKKAQKITREFANDIPKNKIDIRELDLNNLSSIKNFVKGVTADYKTLDVLINNAGIMMCPYSKTLDGFEIQMGTNHLGHFALTGLLMPLLKSTKDSRIVATSSMAHKQGNIDFKDLNWEKRDYKTTKAYSDSKLANLYFAYELKRRFKNDTDAPKVTIAHPGWTKTELDRHSGLAKFLGNLVAQTVEMGTLPSLRAATDLTAQSGDYFGPKGMMEMRGYPVKVKSTDLSHELEPAKKLWDLSEQLTGIKY